MCGILGVINGETSYKKGVLDLNAYMKQGTISGMFRGEDSTGLMQISRKWDVRIMKSVADGYFFSQQKKVASALGNADSTFATIVHHRAATQGAIAIDNCHPFEHEMGDGRWVCGVHNGTIHSYSRKVDGVNFEVDSDWLYYLIARDGAEKALSKIEYGAYALLWAEKPSNRIGMAANNERPLHFAFVKDLNAMIIASEAEHLWYLAQRNGIQIEAPLAPIEKLVYYFDPTGDLRNYTTTEIPAKPASVASRFPRETASGSSSVTQSGIHEIRDTFGPAAELEKLGFKAGEEVEFVLKRSIPITNRGSDMNVVFGEVISGSAAVSPAVVPALHIQSVENMAKAEYIVARAIGVREVTERNTGKQTQVFVICSTPTVEMKQEELLNIEDETPFIRGPRGRIITEKKWNELTKHGCAHCATDILKEQADEIAWSAAGDTPICKACVEDWHEQNDGRAHGVH